MEIVDLLDSDQRILAHSKRGVENDQSFLSFDWGDGSPPLRGAVPDKMDRQTLMEWCAVVRSQYNAREDSKAAKTNRAATVVQRPSDEADTSAYIGSRSGLPDEANDQDPKEVMAQAIEAQITQLGQREAAASAQLYALESELDALHKYHAGLKDSLAYYIALKEKL